MPNKRDPTRKFVCGADSSSRNAEYVSKATDGFIRDRQCVFGLSLFVDAVSQESFEASTAMNN